MSLTGKFIPVDRIIEQVYMDHPFENSIEWDKCLEWVGRALRLMGVPSVLIREVVTVTIEDYKGELPDGIMNIDTVRYKNCTTKVTKAMRYEGDPFILKEFCTNQDSCRRLCNTQSDLTYKLNNNFIFTSFEEDAVEMAVDKFPLDDRGWPLVPDDQAVVEGLSWFIAHKIAYILWLNDQLADKKFQYIRQQKDWYIGKAISKAKTLSKDDMETWLHMTLRLIPKINAHDSHFRDIGNQERRWNHNNDQSQGHI